MSNIRKSFSFRDGVQVDQDVFVVRGSLVGIGTSVPTEVFDVRGTAKVSGLTTTTELMVSGISTFNNDVNVKSVKIGAGIITGTTPSGIVTYYGDGGKLINLPTSQWVDVDPGFGYTSIYAAGNVGVSTNNPEYNFQVGGNPTQGGRGVGFNSTGSIVASGIVTARSFVGFGSGITLINASNISSGTLSNDRLPTINTNKLPSNILVSGIITSNSASFQNITVIGNVTGIASTARSLTGNPNISVTNLTALGSVNVSGTTTSNIFQGSKSIIGISSVTNSLYVGSASNALAVLSNQNVGIGTSIPTSSLQIRNSSGSILEVISDSGQSKISVGQVVGSGNSSADITFGAVSKSLEISNNDTGNFASYIHAGSAGLGTGNFEWVYGQTNQNLMTLTYDGKLGIGETNPTNNLEVVGTSTITSDLYVGGNTEILGSISIGVGGNRVRFGSGQENVLNNTNINTTAGISTVSQLNVLGIGSIGIQTSRPIVDFDARESTGLFASVGIGTTQNPNELTVVGKAVITNGIGINTSQFYIDDSGLETDTGVLQVFGGVSIWNSGIVLRGVGGIGVGTNLPRGSIDLGYARNPLDEPTLFIPPYATTAELDILGGANAPGGMVFNTDTGTYQYTLGDGTEWRDIGAWNTSSEWGVTIEEDYVGIGTTTPDYELDVVGTVGVEGQIVVDGYILAKNIFVSDSGNGFVVSDWFQGNLFGENSNITIGGTIAAPVITAGVYFGDGSNLTGIGISEDLGNLNLTTTGIITATRFVGDGSGLINIPGAGGAANPLIIRDDGVLVGSAATLDFGRFLNVSPVIAGIVTISVSDQASTPWIKTISGITTLSNVGIGTSLPTSALSVFGDVFFNGITTTSSLSVGINGSTFLVNENGFVGIGSDNPTSKLYIVGDQYVTGVITATEFHGNLVGIATRLSPNVNSSTDEFLDIIFVTDDGTSSITGSNLFSYNPNDGILRVDNIELSGLTSTSSLKVGSDGSLITASGSSVGIGSTIPTAALDIVGSVALKGPNRVIDFISGVDDIDYDSGIRFYEGLIEDPRMAIDYNGDSNIPSSGQIEFKGFNSDNGTYNILSVIDRYGNTGIGSTRPSSKLDVIGNVRISGLTTTGSLDVGSFGSVFTAKTTGLVGVGTTTPRTKFEVVGDTNITGTTTSFLLNVGVGASIIRTQSNGFVGIGSTLPTARLDVLGATNLRGNVSVSGIVTASRFVGDASGLTNIPLVSGSVTVLNTDNLIGVATAINFGGKIGVTSVSSGIVTVSVIGANVSISDLPPDGAEDGDLWFSSALGRGFIYYIDEDNTAQWVDFSPATSGIVTARTGGGESVWDVGPSGIGTDANVGIGTTIPAYTLDVAGDINFTGTFYQNGSQFISSKWEEDAENRIYRMTNVGLGTTVPITPLQVERYGVKTGFGTFSASVGIAADIDSFDVSTFDFKTAEYTVHIENGISIQSQKLLVMQNGSTAYSQEYAVMHSGNPLVSIGSTIESGICKIQAVPDIGITGITTYRFVRNTLI